MPATLRFFAVNADDIARARAFYERVLGWTFAPGGPPDFLELRGAGLHGALQARHTIGGREMPGLQVTFAVDDIGATTSAVEAEGGTILMPEFNLESVGRMITFADTEGGLLTACQYHRPLVDLPSPPGAATLRHFAINADDVGRARRFYEQVFDWTFMPWGPPDFYQTRSVGPGRMGALQGRRSIGGHTMPGLELSFAVDDIAAVQAAIGANGGKVIMPPFRIEGVGTLIFFQDPEGNIAGAMQYESVQWPE